MQYTCTVHFETMYIVHVFHFNFTLFLINIFYRYMNRRVKFANAESICVIFWQCHALVRKEQNTKEKTKKRIKL